VGLFDESAQAAGEVGFEGVGGEAGSRNESEQGEVEPSLRVDPGGRGLGELFEVKHLDQELVIRTKDVVGWGIIRRGGSDKLKSQRQ
jgi:hypothetical protein